MLRYGARWGFPATWADDVLKEAAIEGNIITIHSFIRESDINRRLHGDRTALIHAAAHGDFDTVKELLAYGVDTTIRDANGLTAEDHARSANCPNTAALLAAYRPEQWDEVLEVERSLFRFLREFRRRADGNQMDPAWLDKLLARHVEVFDQDADYLWFKASDEVVIGTRMNGRVAWLVKGRLIEEVYESHFQLLR